MSYRVAVRNEQTGETMVVTVEAEHPVEGQEKALLFIFRHYGWRHAVALPPAGSEIDGHTAWEHQWNRFVSEAARRITEQEQERVA